MDRELEGHLCREITIYQGAAMLRNFRRGSVYSPTQALVTQSLLPNERHGVSETLASSSLPELDLLLLVVLLWEASDLSALQEL